MFGHCWASEGDLSAAGGPSFQKSSEAKEYKIPVEELEKGDYRWGRESQSEMNSAIIGSFFFYKLFHFRDVYRDNGNG